MTLSGDWWDQMERGVLTGDASLLEFDLRRVAALIALLTFGVDPVPDGRKPN